MLSWNGDVVLRSTHIICLSADVCWPENVPSKVQVRPPSLDRYDRIWRTVLLASMPMVVAQAVPSEVQPTVGSECKESPVSRGRVVCPQVAPPSPEKNWA